MIVMIIFMMIKKNLIGKKILVNTKNLQIIIKNTLFE